jgi:membrane associated rhomboid family serine protease
VLLPLVDKNPTRRPPIVTMLLIAACVAVYFFVQNPDVETAALGPQNDRERVEQIEFTYKQAAIPCEVVTGEPLTLTEITQGQCNRTDREPPVFPDKHPWLALFVSMFLHGSLLHLGGNMLFLWVFGNNIEDVKGPIVYTGFYVAAGVVATLAHIVLQPSSTVPLVGASGAIAGVMGAYLVVFPRVRIKSIVFFIFAWIRDIEARWLLGFWFVSQFFINPNSGVAWAAHVGGFVFGVLVALAWRMAGGRPDPVGEPYAVPYPPYV